MRKVLTKPWTLAKVRNLTHREIIVTYCVWWRWRWRTWHSRWQRLQQVLPELQRHQVGQAVEGRVAGERRQVRDKEGQELAGGERRGWGSRRGERRGGLVSQMAGLFDRAAWHGEGLLHLSEHSSGQEPRRRLPRGPLGNRITLLENILRP